MKTECPREQDVLDALAARRWPDRCDADLRAHAAGCGLCADLAEVAGALLEDRDAAWTEARGPRSSSVGWRARLHAREDSARAAARPLAFIQGVAAACIVWLAVWVLRAMPWPRVGEAPWPWQSLLPAEGLHVPDVAGLMAAVPGGAIFVVVLAVWMLLAAPVAIYVALKD
jgi:hypothetical protein